MSTSEVDTWQAVSFWTENLTEVPIQFFPKIKVTSATRIETQVPKNKFQKPHVPKRYLTLQFIGYMCIK
jgi:hypothetical protein